MIPDINKYYYALNNCIHYLNKLPRLTRKQIKDNFNANKEEMYFKLNLYGYYGYYKSLDKYKKTYLKKEHLMKNAILLNKLKYVKYLESRLGKYESKTLNRKHNLYIDALIYGRIKILKYFDKNGYFKTSHLDMFYFYSFSNCNYKSIKYTYNRYKILPRRIFLSYIEAAYLSPLRIIKFIISKGANIYDILDINGNNPINVNRNSPEQNKTVLFLKKLYCSNVNKNKLCYFYFVRGPRNSLLT
jgi:hypothetical protein